MVENPKIVENRKNFYYLSLFSKFSEEQFNPFATI